jgi:protein-disulfide isomerase
LQKNVTQKLDGITARLESLSGGVAGSAVPGTQDIKFAVTAPVLGAAEAQVTLVEFADFQCPFCGRFFHDTLPTLKKLYLDTGKAKLIFQNFAFLGEESVRAAEAAKCAGEEGKFWPYHDRLYQKQNGENQGVFSDARLLQFARDLELNISAFANCLGGRKYRAEVAAETESGKFYGITGTPTVFINGRAIVGAQPNEMFIAAIETALQK